jgi:hypothetical protein
MARERPPTLNTHAHTHPATGPPIHPSAHPLVPGVGLKRRWSWMMAMRRKVEVMQSC